MELKKPLLYVLFYFKENFKFQCLKSSDFNPTIDSCIDQNTNFSWKLFFLFLFVAVSQMANIQTRLTSLKKKRRRMHGEWSFSSFIYTLDFYVFFSMSEPMIIFSVLKIYHLLNTWFGFWTLSWFYTYL